MSATPYLDELRHKLTEPELTPTQIQFRTRAYLDARRYTAMEDREVHDKLVLWVLGPVRWYRLRKILNAAPSEVQE